MDVLTTTPFGRRPLTAGLMKRAAAAQAPASVPRIDKWTLFRDLCTARARFGVTDRDLAVLNALLSFHRGNTLAEDGALIVFPSNRRLSERMHGMAESTLRRHLAALCAAGLIHRHDSPNGKRYARRSRDGDITRAFGFDLRPLLVHARAIAQHAAEAEAIAARRGQMREAIILARRDALKLCAYARSADLPGPWREIETTLEAVRKELRRKLDITALDAHHTALQEVLHRIGEALETVEPSGCDGQNERHHQSSDKDTPESETPENDSIAPPRGEPTSALPLSAVLAACPDILPYANGPVRHWHQLVALASFVHRMLGIPQDAWAAAQREMGQTGAAITVAAILQRVEQIRAPGAYLRALTRKAASGSFSPVPMVTALLAAES